MSSSSTPRERRLKPPPNYNSRKVQLRLFLMVAACMFVLYLIVDVANPARWAWFGQEPAAEAPAQPQEEVDTRLPELPESSPTPLGVVTIADPFRGSLNEALDLEANDPISRALADGWSAYYQQSSLDDHDRVALALKQGRALRGLEGAESDAWSAQLAEIDRFWSGYRENAEQVLERNDDDEAALDEAQKKHWMAVLDGVDEAWKSDRAVLAKLAQEGVLELTPQEVERLRRWQLRWERFGLAAIKDDTVHRPAEMDAWFRLFDVLSETSEREMAREAAIPVNFVQLFKQSEDYRGKLVQIRGRIRQAKRVKASKNVYGISHQYMMYIKPEGGPDSPIVVYALEMPKDFPPLEPDLPGGWTSLREDVEVTGYFFKRWAYLGGGGTYTSPLILAKSPHWFPSPDVSQGGTEPPSLFTFLMWMLGAGLFAVTVAAVAYMRSRAVSPAIESWQSSPTAQHELADSLNNAEAGPGVLESLRQLEERHRQPRDEGSSP